jgi:hypothetical protein
MPIPHATCIPLVVPYTAFFSAFYCGLFSFCAVLRVLLPFCARLVHFPGAILRAVYASLYISSSLYCLLPLCRYSLAVQRRRRDKSPGEAEHC